MLALDPLEKSAYEWPTSHSFLPVFVFLFLLSFAIFSFRLAFFLSLSLFLSYAPFLSSLLCLWQPFVSIISASLSFIPPLCSPLPASSRSSTMISHKAAACADENNKRQRPEQGQCNNNINPARRSAHDKSHKTVKLSKHPN